MSMNGISMNELQAPQYRQLGQVTGRVAAIHSDTDGDEAVINFLEAYYKADLQSVIEPVSPGQ